jgi:hypothetical protein
MVLKYNIKKNPMFFFSLQLFCYHGPHYQSNRFTFNEFTCTFILKEKVPISQLLIFHHFRNKPLVMTEAYKIEIAA